MKILIVGHKGQLGFECIRSLANFGDLVFLPDKTLAMVKNNKLVPFLKKTKLDYIVNCAAYTNVDKAESEKDDSFLLNSELPKLLAIHSKENNTPFIHVSTDYVFDGEKKDAYFETDECSPSSQYGKGKWQGEKNIISVNGDYLILRTAWLYGIKGMNFVKKIITLAKEKESLRVVNDQIGCPTNATFLALIISQLILLNKNGFGKNKGIYHAVAEGKASWYEFALKVIDYGVSKAFVPLKEILPCTSEEYKTPAKRPKNSVLSTSKLYDVFQLKMPNWDDQLRMYFETKDWFILEE